MCRFRVPVGVVRRKSENEQAGGLLSTEFRDRGNSESPQLRCKNCWTS